MQNHLLAKLLRKICSQLGFSFQNSIEYLPLGWLESIHWTQRENKAIYTIRGTLSLLPAHPLWHPLRVSFLIWQTRWAPGVTPGHTVLGSCLLVLSTKENNSLGTNQVYPQCNFVFLLLPGLLSRELLLTHSISPNFTNFTTVVLGVNFKASARPCIKLC